MRANGICGFGAAEVREGRCNHPMLELQQHFDQRQHSRARLEMSDVGFDRTDRALLRQRQRVIAQRGIVIAERQTAHFDRISERGPGAMRFDVGDGARVDASSRETAPDRFRLGLRVGRSEPHGAAARAQAGTLDHAVDAIPAAARIFERPQDDDAGAFA
jgi:hypothetical protein